MDKEAKIGAEGSGFRKDAFCFVLILILTIAVLINTMPAIIGYAQMQRANEAAFVYARARATEIEEVVLGLTRDEVTDILGSTSSGFLSVTGITRMDRHPDLYQMWYEIGWYYEWSRYGNNFRQSIRIVIEKDEEGEAMASTYLIKQINSSDFVIMD